MGAREAAEAGWVEGEAEFLKTASANTMGSFGA